MRGNPEGGELDLAEDVQFVHRRCKKNSFVLSCIGKRTKEGCDRGSEVGTADSRRNGEETVHNGRDGEERVVREQRRVRS